MPGETVVFLNPAKGIISQEEWKRVIRKIEEIGNDRGVEVVDFAVEGETVVDYALCCWMYEMIIDAQEVDIVYGHGDKRSIWVNFFLGMAFTLGRKLILDNELGEMAAGERDLAGFVKEANINSEERASLVSKVDPQRVYLLGPVRGVIPGSQRGQVVQKVVEKYARKIDDLCVYKRFGRRRLHGRMRRHDGQTH